MPASGSLAYGGHGVDRGAQIEGLLAAAARVAIGESRAPRMEDRLQVADGAATIEQVGWELFQLMLDVASGRKKTWAEHWKLHNALVLSNPAPVT